MGKSLEGGKIEDADFEPPEEALNLLIFRTKKPGYMEIEFDQGVPVAVDGVDMAIAD